MIVKFPFGAAAEAVDLRGLRVWQVSGQAPRGLVDLDRAIERALDEPLAGPPLAEIAGRGAFAAVIVPDGTRAAALPQVLPRLLERLRAGGIASDRTTIVVACGTHPAMPASDLDRHLGPLPAGITVMQHDAQAEDELVTVGTLDDGTPARLHRAVVDAAVLITVGAVSHHYFAGFGGGPKMVFPGVAGYREIQRNHSRVLERVAGGWRRRAGCEAGVLAGNPIAAEIAAIAALRPPDFALCLVPGADGRPGRVFGGGADEAFGAAVETVRGWYEVAAIEPTRLVVASGGGVPYDRTLIQAHKRLDAAARFVAAGGELLFIAAMDAGDGSPDMAQFVADPRPEAIGRRLEQRWIQYGHTTLRIVEKTAAATVWLRSNYPDGAARRLGFRPVADAADVVDGWRDRFPGQTVTVLTGPAVYPRRSD